jgi:predicted MPP superfamily phosphohydrolase
VVRWSAQGRGKHYSAMRGILESVARVVYAGGWPGRLWGYLPGRVEVDLLCHDLPLLPARVGVPRPELRIAFMSDLHVGPLTPPALLDRAFARVTNLCPDVLLLGGDYVYLDATPSVLDALERRIRAVPAAVKLAVFGNHDLWTDHDAIERALRRAGAAVLVNQSIRLPAPFDDVAIVGLDEPWSGEPDRELALRGTEDAALVVGLAHSPEAVPLLMGSRVRLLLCGHTHGGQVALPSGPLLVHGAHGRLWPSGLHTLGPMQLFVSRGLGAVELPFRIGARPDVSLFRLRSE